MLRRILKAASQLARSAQPHSHHHAASTAAAGPACVARITTEAYAAGAKNTRTAWQAAFQGICIPGSPLLAQTTVGVARGWQAQLVASCSPRGFATITQRKAAANPGLKFWKPTSPGQRGRVTIRRTGIWRGGPKRCLARGTNKTGGRNHSGRITVWHRGGGARKVLRNVDFKRRTVAAQEGIVERIEYDPGRTSYIALVRHEDKDRARTRELSEKATQLRQGLAANRKAAAAARKNGPQSSSGGVSRSAADGGSPNSSSSSSSSSSGGGSSGGGSSGEYMQAVSELLAQLKDSQRRAKRGPQARFSYIVAPQELQPGDEVASRSGAPIRPGNMMRLRDIPIGMPVHNLELKPGQGAALCRSAGCVATIVNKQETHAIVRLPSGEQRLFTMECRATVGAVSNPQHRNRVIGKAGYARHLGRRPIVRGVAMNPVDHPHGGGTAGGRPSVTPWGVPCKGYKTRRKSPMARWILVPRKRGKAAGSQRGGQ